MKHVALDLKPSIHWYWMLGAGKPIWLNSRLPWVNQPAARLCTVLRTQLAHYWPDAWSLPEDSVEVLWFMDPTWKGDTRHRDRPRERNYEQCCSALLTKQYDNTCLPTSDTCNMIWSYSLLWGWCCWYSTWHPISASHIRKPRGGRTKEEQHGWNK